MEHEGARAAKARREVGGGSEIVVGGDGPLPPLHVCEAAGEVVTLLEEQRSCVGACADGSATCVPGCMSMLCVRMPQEHGHAHAHALGHMDMHMATPTCESESREGDRAERQQ